MTLANRLALVLAFPFLLGASALADDTPKPPGGDPKTPPAKPDAAKPEEGEKIAWIHDYDEAKKKADAEKKGLFVYLTPTWFT